MKSKITLIAGSLFLIMSIVSCNKEELIDRSPSGTNSNAVQTICGTAEVQTIFAGQTIPAGNLIVSNDNTNLYITYSTSGGWVMNVTHLYVGVCNGIPTTHSGNPQIGLFPYNTTHSTPVTSYTYTIPLANLDSCYCIAAHCGLSLLDNNGNIIQTETGWGNGVSIGGNSWAMKFSYCTQYCTPPCEIASGDYRTQTQGGWGAAPNGNNPAAYLYNNFDNAFPYGLIVGCGNKTITLTSAQAVTNFLPQGGTATVISQSYIDPINSISVLAGQTVTLKLSVTFDSVDPSFGNSNNSLSSLVIASGTFQGWTVGQLLAEAENILGGCSSNYSPSEINSALDQINNNFDNGTVVGTFLVCP